MGPSAIIRDDYLSGGCQVDGTAGTFAWTPAGVVSSVVRVSLGVWLISLSPGASPTEHTITTQRIGADTDRVGINVDPVSATEVYVRASSATDAGPVDTDFFLTIRRIRTAG